MRTRARITLAGLVLGIALVGSVAWATIPDAAGVINGCYRTSLDDQKGQLRIVDDPASCRSNESPIQWNEEGPTGDTGAQGIQGLQGIPGDAGAAGTNGTNGAAGVDGINGTDGTDGSDGQDGQDGVDGAAGTNGNHGVDGVSVISEALSPGDPTCANGGSKFTAANGITYACDGAPGTGSTVLAVTETIIPNGTESIILDSLVFGVYRALCGANAVGASIILTGSLPAPGDRIVAAVKRGATAPVLLGSLTELGSQMFADSIIVTSVGNTAAGAVGRPSAIGELMFGVFTEQQSGTYACKVVSQLKR